MAPRRIPYNFNNETKDRTHWSNLKRKSIFKNDRLNFDNLVRSRRAQSDSQFVSFRSAFRRRGRAQLYKPILDFIKSLTYWCRFQSWTFCNTCRSLHTNSLLPKQLRSRGCVFTPSHVCVCKGSSYTVPKRRLIPVPLSNLTKDDNDILRIYKIDIGKKTIALAGHRIKKGAFELRYREDTVSDRINAVTDDARRTRLRSAYDFLKGNRQSHYKRYLSIQSVQPAESKIKFWDVYHMPGIECALWPSLYPFSTWCETLLEGSKASILHSFRAKLLSDITSYNNDFELLQFHYDRWLYKTISGAVSVGKGFTCSPLRALEDKHFTAGYWKWQNRYLVDACLQFGYPTLFITMSPYEWDFPKSLWIEQYLEVSGAIPTKSGAVETLHIAHILDQICRGYITGVNSNTWESHDIKHVLFPNKHPKPGNVKCVFYRFEYQKRRTIHVHMLVWLESMKDITVERFKAAVPTDNVEHAYLVTRLQKSNERAPFLTVCDRSETGHQDMRLKHSQSDADLKLRAYIDTVLHLLKSRMDVQVTDGKAALMKYVASYVSKLTENAELLRNTNTTVFQQLWPFLIDLQPGEPEMAMAFSSTPMSYCNVTRAKLVPPSEDYFDDSSLISKYINRASCDDTLTLLKYCRMYNTSLSLPTLAANPRLVGVQYKYIFNPRFFFEYTIVNTPFRALNDIQIPDYELLPSNLSQFSYFFHNHRDIVKTPHFKDFLHFLGYKEAKITEFLKLCDGYITLLYKFSANPRAFGLEVVEEVNLSELTMEQRASYNTLIDKVEYRCKLSLREFNATISVQSSSSSGVISAPVGTTNASVGAASRANSAQSAADSSGNSCSASLNTDGYSANSRPHSLLLESPSASVSSDLSHVTVDKVPVATIHPVLIRGKPGTGKSHVINCLVRTCVDNNLHVLFAYATAKQARDCSAVFNSPFVMADTVHSVFRIPVGRTVEAQMNWGLLQYDVLIIDEVGMVLKENMQHIFNSLDRLPLPIVTALVGDPGQQLPLTAGEDGRTTVGMNIFQSKELLSRCTKFTLCKQHRFSDIPFERLIDTLRCSRLDDFQLQRFNNRALFATYTESCIVEAFRGHPAATFLAATRAGCKTVNHKIISHLFTDDECLGTIFDSSLERLELYKGMNLVLTENLIKHHSLVNGASCTVVSFNNQIIVVRLFNGRLSFLWPRFNEDEHAYYPILANYCSTIFKAQGKNLAEIVVWFDGDIPMEGQAYVAFSRVKHMYDIHLLTPVDRRMLLPINFEALNPPE